MLTLNIGPLVLSIPQLLLVVSLLLAMLTGWWVGRRRQQNPERQVFRLLLLALVVARLAFVAVYFEAFSDNWWGMLDIRDGGFIPWPGILAALLAGGWLLWRNADLRKPLAAALAVGVLSWGFTNLGWHAFEQGTRLPEMALRDISGAPVNLEDYTGKPLVINLWATWCPPCRREMPVLAEAQKNHDEFVFLFVNQGEGEGEIERFLQGSGLDLRNLLIDSGGRLGQHVGSQALPTTLFYDAQGRQVGAHLGELSRASLSQALKALQPAPLAHGQQPR